MYHIYNKLYYAAVRKSCREISIICYTAYRIGNIGPLPCRTSKNCQNQL